MFTILSNMTLLKILYNTCRSFEQYLQEWKCRAAPSGIYPSENRYSRARTRVFQPTVHHGDGDERVENPPSFLSLQGTSPSRRRRRNQENLDILFFCVSSTLFCVSSSIVSLQRIYVWIHIVYPMCNQI